MPFNPKEETPLIPAVFRVAMTVGGAFVVELPVFFITPLAIRVFPKLSAVWVNFDNTLAVSALCICTILITACKIIWRLAFNLT
jgi:hypothetical protein